MVAAFRVFTGCHAPEWLVTADLVTAELVDPELVDPELVDPER
jgi:hypothetical protein